MYLVRACVVISECLARIHHQIGDDLDEFGAVGKRVGHLRGLPNYRSAVANLALYEHQCGIHNLGDVHGFDGIPLVRRGLQNAADEISDSPAAF